jgi:hypothetical protein
MCLNFWHCKKTEPGTALPYTKSLYTPPAYDPGLYHYGKKVCGAFPLNAIVVDSLDKTQAYIIGDFNSGSVFGLSNATGIVKLNSNTSSFSSYPTDLTGVSSIRAFFQSSSGLQYIGGTLDNGITTGFFGFKQINSPSVTIIPGLSDRVTVIKELGNNIYFSGDFMQYNSVACTPILYCDKTTHSPLNQYANGSILIMAKQMEYFQNYWYIARNASSTNIFFSNGTISNYVAFNNYCFNILAANGKLYACGWMTALSSSTVALRYVSEYNGTAWSPTGTGLKTCVVELKYNAGRLYGCTTSGVYYLNVSNNKWENALQGSELSFANVQHISFVGDKLYLYDGYQGLFEFIH